MIRCPRATRSGFTLVELLVAVTIIAVLLTLLAVAVRGVVGMAQGSQTSSMLGTISQAITAFKGDFGYEPPLISSNAPNAGGIRVPELLDNAADIRRDYRARRYHSQFSLPVYLLGMGNINGVTTESTETFPNSQPVGQDSPNYRTFAAHDGVPGPGLREPGKFRCWKVPSPVIGASFPYVHEPTLVGRTYGPYLDPQQMAKLIQPVEVISSPDWPLRPRGRFDPPTKVFMYRLIDPRGGAIRYYRGYPLKDPVSGEASVKRVPVELRESGAVAADIARGSGNYYPRPEDRALMGSTYMLLAPNQQPATSTLTGAAASFAENEVDQVCEESMPFYNQADPVFNGSVMDDVQRRRLLNFLKLSVRHASP